MTWVKHDGRGYPFDTDASAPYVRVQIRSSTAAHVKDQTPVPADLWLRWTHNNNGGDIVAYEVVT